MSFKTTAQLDEHHEFALQYVLIDGYAATFDARFLAVLDAAFKL